MDKSVIAKLLELIGEAVRSSGSWEEKRAAILAEASEEDQSNLGEFAAWFE